MNPPNAQLATIAPAELVRQSTDIAALCKTIVLASARKIQGRQFVCVEGWMAIATAHGCVAGAKDVEKVEGGIRAIGEIRRVSDGTLLATAEGFVGDDEETWAKRPEYARRAMAQTRAISRVCRSAFAHVVVMMNAGLSTTPAEEADFAEDHTRQRVENNEQASDSAATVGDWRTVEIHFGKKKGTPLAKLDAGSVRWYRDNGLKSIESGKASKDDRKLVAACDMALVELNPTPGTKPATGRTDAAQGNPRETLKSMLGFDGKTTEEELIAAAHQNGINSDVENIAQMSDDEAQTCIKNFDKLICK